MSAIKSARWTWRRRSPPARSRRRSLGFLQRLDEPPEVLEVGEEGTVEELGAAALDQDGGEVLHLPVADFRGVVLDVEPAEARAGELLRQREEALAVALAAVAPQRANTSDIHRDVRGRVHR